ncbi:hypothetical protein acdb102_16840 [Acidothermaceae bacterium B102]|nr:hypothetical protein acdb102_16840 [Acidothermaceae bacterium B102]
MSTFDSGSGWTLLPAGLASESPAGVLLVDLDTRQVVHANSVAQQLAPGVSLPAPLDAWSDAAALRDVTGAELSDTRHPLSLVARSEPVAGQAVSAARSTELGARREPMWVVGLPMSGAPQLEGHALVVFLPLRDRAAAEAAATAAAAAAELRDRAVVATGLSFTLADAQAPDLPLLWVNPAFTSTTGYTFDEVVGRNCRFLQGPATDEGTIRTMREALRDGVPHSGTLLNYRKDGTAFWNQVSLSPIFGPDGELTHYVGIQTDVTAQVATDRERDEALAAERAARADAELAHVQLALLAEATSQLAATLDVAESLDRLAQLVVPVLADWMVVVTAGRERELETVSGRHRDGMEDVVAAYAEAVRTSVRNSPFDDLLAGKPGIRASLSDEAFVRQRNGWAGPEVQALSNQLGVDTVLYVPLPGRHAVLGAMALVRRPGSPPYTEVDLSVASDLGRRAGLTLDNARLYQAEHRVAVTLQQSLLPTLPTLPGLQVAARYLASETAADVGGDFYELMALPDGGVGLAIGDIVGHDIRAAAAMGHLRGMLRACAWNTEAERDPTRSDPARVLTRLDRLIQGLEVTTLATACYARLERGPEDGWRITYSSAGHPPLLVRLPDGSVSDLDAGDGLMLGVADHPRTSATRDLPAGTTILGYTDGLIERRGASLQSGLSALRRTLAAGSDDLERLAHQLIATHGDSEDDVALIAVRLGSDKADASSLV